jgi:hypothetical protein
VPAATSTAPSSLTGPLMPFLNLSYGYLPLVSNSCQI